MRTLLLSTLLVAGCFGDGDTPTLPSEATILLSIPPPGPTDLVCNSSRYIGNVSIGNNTGYAVTHAFTPVCNNNSGGNPGQDIPATLFEFSLAGGQAHEFGMAGMVAEGGGEKPRVLAIGDDAVYTFQTEPGPKIVIGSKSGMTAGNIQTSMGATTAGSIVADATQLYIAAWNTPTYNTMPNHPRFPCCGNSTNSMQNYEFLKMTRAIPGTAGAFPTKPKFYCEQTSRCLVGNSTTLFYFEHGPIAQQAVINSQPIAGGTPAMIASFGRAPTGIVANDNFVVWSTSIDYSQISNGVFGNIPESCVISMAPTNRLPAPEIQLISTDRFSCMDVALDGDDIYFTITRLDRTTGDGGVVGVGLGRVSSTSHVVETLRTGINAIEAGPRSLYIAGDRIIGVGPLIVASFPKHALDGRLEFVP